ncbi:hypothetical protein JYT27_00165 [bacterium AH-315-D21]|nr:hypothetical protein [bacterium AH-315-D21]
MPIIDVSQNSYRALVKAAHKQRMSIDRFIQHRLAENADASSLKGTVRTGMAAVGKGSAPGVSTRTDRAVIGSVPAVERRATGSAFNRHDSSFEALWERIKQNTGTVISTKRGQGFTYEVEAGYLTVRESGARVPQSQFKKALGQWPTTGPSAMRGVYAASVVWAVLSDDRLLSAA